MSPRRVFHFHRGNTRVINQKQKQQVMNLFPNPQELVSEETIEEVKYIEEISQHQAFKTAISREELNEISEQDLLETVEWAKGHQEENADRLKKKTRQFGVATGTMSFPLAHEDAPVTLSL